MIKSSLLISVLLAVIATLKSAESFCQTADAYYKSAGEKASEYEYDAAIKDYGKT